MKRTIDKVCEYASELHLLPERDTLEKVQHCDIWNLLRIIPEESNGCDRSASSNAIVTSLDFLRANIVQNQMRANALCNLHPIVRVTDENGARTYADL